MKKIVALALSLIMVLALCTVAFAATKTEEISMDGYSLKDMNNTATATDLAVEKFTKTVTDKQVVTEGSKTTTTYYADKYVFGDKTYYACDASMAEVKLIKGSEVVCLTSKDLSAGTTAVATKVIEAKDEPKCGEFDVDVIVVDGKNYVAGGDNFAVLNGKFVAYGDEATPVAHTFAKNNTTTDTKGKIVSIKCDVCEKSFEVVDKVPTGYTGDTQALGAQWILMGAAAGAGAATTSPKTFDAGIAMYAGMALMSVAGSAVVIGKKKEF